MFCFEPTTLRGSLGLEVTGAWLGSLRLPREGLLLTGAAAFFSTLPAPLSVLATNACTVYKYDLKTPLHSQSLQTRDMRKPH